MLSFIEFFEEKQRLDPKCWDGYKKKGTKMKGGVRVNNCVKEEAGKDMTIKQLQQKFKDGTHEALTDVKVGRHVELRNTKTGKTSHHYVKEDKGMEGMTQKGGHKRPTEDGAGLTQKGVEKYRRQNPGSKLQTAVTTPPSKLKPGSKAAKRRKSFCARSRSWTGERGKAARRRWNC